MGLRNYYVRIDRLTEPIVKRRAEAWLSGWRTTPGSSRPALLESMRERLRKMKLGIDRSGLARAIGAIERGEA